MYFSAHSKRLACVATLFFAVAGSGFLVNHNRQSDVAAATDDRSGCYRVLKDLPNITIRQGEPLLVLYCDNDDRLVSVVSRRQSSRPQLAAYVDRRS